jgi:hypothetical protein
MSLESFLYEKRGFDDDIITLKNIGPSNRLLYDITSEKNTSASS